MKSISRLLLSAVMLAALFLGSLPAPAIHAAAFTVTNLNDTGTGSLRDAIEAANLTDTDDVITINPLLTGTITLASELDILKPVIITGPGANRLTISGNNATRVFATSADTTITGLTIANGAVIDDIANPSDEFGAGILVNAGTLTLDQVTIRSNIAKRNDRITSGLGGGIYVSGSAHLAMTNSAVIENKAVNGSAIFILGSASLTNCTISGNRSVHVLANGTEGSDGGFGAINLAAGTLALTNITLTNNSARNFEAGLTLQTGTQSSISNSIVAANIRDDNSDPKDIQLDGDVNSNGHNLIGSYVSTTTFTFSESVPVGSSPSVGVLDIGLSNGGTTPYHPLQGTSVAINQGEDSAAFSQDQRGYYRPDQSDIGAFEYNGLSPAVPVLAATPTSASITGTTAVLGGNMTNLGVPSPVTERGIYWSTTTPVGLANKVPEAGPFNSTGAFTVFVDNLPPASTIHFKAFATNATGTGFSGEGSFTTASAPNPEPSLFPAPFWADPLGRTTIQTVWPEVDSGDLPDGYLVVCYTGDSFTPPVDGTPQLDQDCSTGSGYQNIPASKIFPISGSLAFTWTGLTEDTTYHFTIFPYSNANALINYLTDASSDGRPTAEAATARPEPSGYPTAFQAAPNSTQAITTSWTPPSTGIIPDRYLVLCKAHTVPAFPAVADGTDFSDADCKTGVGTKNIFAVIDGTSFQWTGLDSGVDYDFVIYPYTNTNLLTDHLTGSIIPLIDYKTDGAAPTATARTDKLAASNHPTLFTAKANGYTQITTSWTDASGAVPPDSYLVLCNLTGIFTPPAAGSALSDDTNCSDGSGVKNVLQGAQTYAWAGLSPATHYYFKIYPATNAGTQIQYKLDGVPLTADATTLRPIYLPNIQRP